MSAISSRLGKLEARLGVGDVEVDAVFIGIWNGHVGGEALPVDGWSFTCRIRGNVEVRRLPGESDESLAERAKHDAHLHLSRGSVPFLLSIAR
jgi:hypothetical protein